MKPLTVSFTVTNPRSALRCVYVTCLWGRGRLSWYSEYGHPRCLVAERLSPFLATGAPTHRVPCQVGPSSFPHLCGLTVHVRCPLAAGHPAPSTQ